MKSLEAALKPIMNLIINEWYFVWIWLCITTAGFLIAIGSPIMNYVPGGWMIGILTGVHTFCYWFVLKLLWTEGGAKAKFIAGFFLFCQLWTLTFIHFVRF